MNLNPHYINEISCEDNFDPNCNPLSEAIQGEPITSQTIKEVSEDLKIDLNELRNCVRGVQVNILCLCSQRTGVSFCHKFCATLLWGARGLCLLFARHPTFFLQKDSVAKNAYK